METIFLTEAFAEMTIKTSKAILEFYKKHYGAKKEDLEKGEGETFAQLSELQMEAVVLERSYSSWIREGKYAKAMEIVKNSGLFEDLPKSNPAIIGWFRERMNNVRAKILGSVRALRALERELGYELYSIRVDLSLVPKVSVTFQKFQTSELLKPKRARA